MLDASPSSPEYRLRCKVYYEDTDCMGVVYHANYLRFMERARTEFLAERGISVAQMDGEGALFVVYHVDMTFKAPARLGDELDVVTTARVTSPFRITFDQRIECPARVDKPLVTAEIEIVCIGRDGAVRQVPDIGL
jgi:acyl-CoA thioester hydrolase